MTFLSRDQILANRGVRQFETVHAPAWGGDVRVQSLMGSERDNFEGSVITGKGKNRDTNFKNLRAKLVALAVVDEGGQRLFTEADVPALGELDAGTLDRVFSAAQKLSGLANDDVDELTTEPKE